MELSPKKSDEIQRNIRRGIERLRAFQTPGGGFAYWPGAREADEWASSYAGHFLVEARRAGYAIKVPFYRWLDLQQYIQWFETIRTVVLSTQNYVSQKPLSVLLWGRLAQD